MESKCDCYHTKQKLLYAHHPVTGKILAYDIEVGICYGTKEMDECSCGGDRSRCNFYPVAVSIKDAISHYKHGITHDIFSEPVTTYAQMSIEALEKQIPKKPIHIHEEHSEHLWQRNKDGTIDTSAMSSVFHNGPYCTRCHHSECEHCNPEWETNPEEPCVVDKDICPSCGKEVDLWQEGNYCPSCGQALDWSD